jgi:hypothetical protein
MKRIILAIALFTGAASALSVAPTDCSNSSRSVCTDVMRPLKVEPVSVQHFYQLTEPDDIQPAYGYNGLQQTSNVQ